VNDSRHEYDLLMARGQAILITTERPAGGEVVTMYLDSSVLTQNLAEVIASGVVTIVERAS
jgi:hypothetical protein